MSNVIIEAARFAKDAHKGQIRNYSGEPYITHPSRVAGAVTLLDYATEDDIAAAWLHDVAEDTDISLDRIAATFNTGIARLCGELYFKAEYSNLLRAERKELQRIKVRNSSFRARSIKVLDRIDNLTDLLANLCADSVDHTVLYFHESNLMFQELQKVDTDPALLQDLQRALWSLGEKRRERNC